MKIAVEEHRTVQFDGFQDFREHIHIDYCK